MSDQHYDLILVGTGFAATFFLMEYLQREPADRRVLVLERGDFHDHIWQVQNRRQSAIDYGEEFINDAAEGKRWAFNLGFGGSSNCWWAGTPRQMPADFELKSRYGVGYDWPVSYDELQDGYDLSEQLLGIAGDSNAAPYPRRTPYPLPPHNLTEADKVLQAAYPNLYMAQPTARASRTTETRNRCCANGVCGLCPVDAKFTIQNTLRHVFDDPRVTLSLNSRVWTVDREGGRVVGVTYKKDGRDHEARGDLIGLAANAIYNPEILLRSGFDHPLIGKRLHEQASTRATVFLDGMDHFQGSTVITANGWMLYDGEHRRDGGACLLDMWNQPFLRPERGRQRQVLSIYLTLEDIPQDNNEVVLNPDDDSRPIARFRGWSDYVRRGRDRAHDQLERVLAPLPVERIEHHKTFAPLEGHIQGTVVAAHDPAEGVVDRNFRMHSHPNLLVLGCSAYPSAAPANPTLTLCAWVIRAARQLTGSQEGVAI